LTSVDDPLRASLTSEQDALAPSPAKAARTIGAHVCAAQPLELPPGCDAALTYPFALHATRGAPAFWPELGPDGVRLRSSACRRTVASEGDACLACSELLRDKVVRGIVDRAGEPFKSSVNYRYLGHTLLIERMFELQRQLNSLQLSVRRPSRRLR
jgi:hypothetical protein